MKKIVILALTGMICFSMAACNMFGFHKNNGTSSEQVESTDNNVGGISTEEHSHIGESSKDSSETKNSENNETENVTTEEESQKDNTEISAKPGPYLNSLFEFKVSIGKIAYRIPIAYSAMTSRNWVYEDDDTVTLKPSQYTSEEFMDRDDVILYVSFFNMGINTQEIKDSLIGQITFDKLNLVGCETEIRFPGNIIYGQSTKDDLLKAYGEPTRIEEKDDKEVLIYEKGEYEWVKFTVDSDTQVINNVDMCNFTEPENFDGGTINEEIPEEVSNYKEPEDLGEDLSVAYVKLGSNVYSLPAPVSEFLENGWRVVEDESHQAVVAKGVGVVTLEKDGILISSDVINYADNAVYIENCFVTTVYVDLEENEKGNLSIPLGISVNMPSSELEKLLENVEYETSMDRKYVYYTIHHSGTEGNGFIIRVNKESLEVNSIICQSIPSDY